MEKVSTYVLNCLTCYIFLILFPKQLTMFSISALARKTVRLASLAYLSLDNCGCRARTWTSAQILDCWPGAFKLMASFSTRSSSLRFPYVDHILSCSLRLNPLFATYVNELGSITMRDARSS